MKKITTLILALTCFAMANSFSQSTLFVENATIHTIEVTLYSYDLATCTQNNVTPLTVPPGASIPVTSPAGSEYIVGEFEVTGCGSQLAVEADGLVGGCLPCPSFGIPSGVFYNLCSAAPSPFKAVWNSYCGSNNPHLHFYQ